MIIKQETAEMIVNMFLSVSKDIALQAHGYLGSHSKPIGYCKYPILQPKIDCGDPETQKSIDEIPYIKFNVPRYELRDFPKDRVLYSAIFDGYGNDTIDILGNSEGVYCFYQTYRSYLHQILKLNSALAKRTCNTSHKPHIIFT